MMQTRTGGAAVLVAADGEGRSAMPPVPRLADHNTSWRTSRFPIRRIVRWRQVNRGSCCIKIKQLRVHTRPFLELCGRCMLMKSQVIGQPNIAAKIQMRTKDDKLILQKVPPAVREVRHQNEGEDRKLFGPHSNILNSSMQFLRLRRQHQTIMEEKLWPGSLACRFAGSRSHRSTYLPVTIWKTIFTITGEMPGPTTNGWSATTEAEVGGTLAMVSRQSTKGAGRVSCEWNGRQCRGSENRHKWRHHYRRSWNRPTCRWLSNFCCWCWDHGNAPNSTRSKGHRATIAASTDWAIKATISGDREMQKKTGQPEQKWRIRQHQSIGALERPQKQTTRQTAAGNC